MEVQKWKLGLKFFVDNAERLQNNGKILLENRSYGLSYFCYYTAIEELGVAYFILHYFNDPKPKQLEKFHRNHALKRNYAIYHLFKPEVSELLQTGSMEIKETVLKRHLKQIEKRSTILDGEEIEIQFTDQSFQHLLGKQVNKMLKLMSKRNKGIYVSLNKKKTDWHTPGEIKESDILKLKPVVEEKVKRFKEIYKNLLSIKPFDI